jgi:rubrerythrin
MKTTQQWLAEVKANPEKLTHWLKRQYIGEALAADRIKALAEITTGQHKAALEYIASDEAKHSGWVAELLKARGIELPVPSYDGTRYWAPILANLNTFAELMGAGHHAETMRLVRITALAADEEIDADIREVFTKILPDEERHARLFAAMSDANAIASTKDLHQKGLEALGLEI